MKFAIFREIKKGKRKFLLEWDRKQIEDALVKKLPDAREYNVRKAFTEVIEDFKRETIKIP